MLAYNGWCQFSDLSHLKKTIRRLGGCVVESMEECTHLIAQKVGRTCVYPFLTLSFHVMWLPVMVVHAFMHLLHVADFKDSEVSNWSLQLQVHTVQGVDCCQCLCRQFCR